MMRQTVAIIVVVALLVIVLVAIGAIVVIMVNKRLTPVEKIRRAQVVGYIGVLTGFSMGFLTLPTRWWLVLSLACAFWMGYMWFVGYGFRLKAEAQQKAVQNGEAPPARGKAEWTLRIALAALVVAAAVVHILGDTFNWNF
jgi:hypothetical protein